MLIMPSRCGQPVRRQAGGARVRPAVCNYSQWPRFARKCSSFDGEMDTVTLEMRARGGQRRGEKQRGAAGGSCAAGAGLQTQEGNGKAPRTGRDALEPRRPQSLVSSFLCPQGSPAASR